MSLIRLTILLALVLVPSPLLAQSSLEKRVSVGAANLVSPMITAGMDLIAPEGPSIGVSGTLITTFEGPWALYGGAASVGFHGRGPTRNHPFVAAELGYFRETDCCGGSVMASLGGGVTHWWSAKSGLRIEGRLSLPLGEEGGLIAIQVGWAFR